MWPDRPSIRFLIWAQLRAKELCESSNFCNDHPSEHAADCQCTLLAESMMSAAGVLLDRALETEFILDKGFHLDLGEIPADEYNVLRILKAEQNKFEREQADKDKQHGTDANRHRGRQ